MNEVKRQAIETMDELHQTIPYCSYCAVMDGLQEIETLRDRDEELEKLWAEFGDVPMNPETECIEAPFMGWGVGIHREEYGVGLISGIARALPTCCTEVPRIMYRRQSGSMD